MHLLSHPRSMQLLPQGAVFLSECGTLVVADIHLGKSAAFRAQGLPVPEGDTARDFQRLLDLAQKLRASHLVVAGDLFHAPAGITPELNESLRVFLGRLAIPLTLVVGNHDAKIRNLPAGMGSVPFLELPDVKIIHDPDHAAASGFHLSGHWHPVVKIRDGYRKSLRFPCFLLRGTTLVLPAFGSFTGGSSVAPTTGDRIFVAMGENVIELPAALIR